jgi:hypothetical protein
MGIDFVVLGLVFVGFFVLISIIIQEIRPEIMILSVFLSFIFMIVDLTFSLGYINKPKIVEMNNTELISLSRHRDNLYIEYIDEYGLNNDILGIELDKFKNIYISKGKQAKISFKLYYFMSSIIPADIEGTSVYITLPENVKIPDLNNKKDQFSFYKYNDFGFKQVNNYNCYSNVELQNDTYVFSDTSNNIKFEYKSTPSIDIQRDSNLIDKVCLEINVYQNEKGYIYEKDHLNNRQILRIPDDFDDYNLYIREEG